MNEDYLNGDWALANFNQASLEKSSCAKRWSMQSGKQWKIVVIIFNFFHIFLNLFLSVVFLLYFWGLKNEREPLRMKINGV